MFLKTKVIDDITGVAGKAFDVLSEIGRDVVRITLELLEGKTTCIVEGLPGCFVENRFNVLDLAAL